MFVGLVDIEYRERMMITHILHYPPATLPHRHVLMEYQIVWLYMMILDYSCSNSLS